MEHAATDGWHFLPTSSINDTCHGIVHLFILKYSIMNQLHENTQCLLWHLLTSWINWYLDNDDFTGACIDNYDMANH